MTRKEAVQMARLKWGDGGHVRRSRGLCLVGHIVGERRFEIMGIASSWQDAFRVANAAATYSGSRVSHSSSSSGDA